MAYSLCDAAVPPCAQQLGALAGIIDKAAAQLRMIWRLRKRRNAVGSDVGFHAISYV
jgi:hypothetical protein